jgi:hypothetical protein
MTNRELAEKYLDAFAKRDIKKMRSFLSDTNFTFRGPLQAFNSADEFAAALVPLAPMIQGVSVKQVIADGNDVCLFYDFVTNVPAVGTTRIAEWLHIENGKITFINLYFDPRPYVPLFAQK